LGDFGALIKSVTHIPVPDEPWGVPSIGGEIVTAGGLVFIAGALGDPHFRAFDIDTGRVLWSSAIPASGNATPMTYSINGRQYVVIAAGGHSKADVGTRSDALVAFALPVQTGGRSSGN
jgi:quinoprotein glucose dehydrogenase